ncbi:unnamed protein product [Pleuronectes platessa]|uniref:Uncharacterized protein n=1 Tax=Pleuronectes platessa TaxID=8262 RepID=A0A9N7V0T2_PLEPL|nr:unnamed protein product [Pleuronectes platessa]
MDNIGSTAGQLKADCQAFQRDVIDLELQLGKQRARVRQNRELPGDEAHEKLAELQPLDESYCDTDEEMWQPEDGEEEDDWGEDTQQSEDGEVEDDSDEDTQQPEDCEEDSETLSTGKILIETDLHSYYKELQEAYVIKQQLFASELQFERSKNKVLLDELEKLKASNNELSQRYEAENLRAGQQASHLMALIEQDESQMHSFHAEQNFLRLQIMEEMRCLRNSAAEEKMLLQRQVEELTSQLSLMKEREDVKHQEWQEERDEEKQEEKWGELQEAYIIKQQMFASELQFERSTVKALLDELDKLRASQLSLKKEREDVNHQEWQEERDEEKQEEKLGELQEASIIKQQMFASELQFERSTVKALLDELDKLRASNNEIIQRAEADNLRAGQQASHLMAELEKVRSQMNSFQAEQNLLRLQITEEMRCLCKSAAEEKMLLQREVEELTSQLSLKKEREDVKHQEWQEERDEEKQEEKWGELQEASIIKQQMFASELQFERSTVKALLDELDKLRASNNEIIQTDEADNLRAGQQASHLMAELEKVRSQMNSFQAEQNLLRLQITEEMRCLCKSAAEEKMLLQREEEELTSQLSLKKEREDVKQQEWQEERDEEKREDKWGEEQQEKDEVKWGEEAGGGEPVDKPAYLESNSDALPASEPVETELSKETPKKKKSSIWKKIRQHLGLRRRKKQPHN